MQFTLGELGAAIEVGGPLVVICWNNFGYAEIKSSMIAKGVAPIGVDLHTPDFVEIAKAYGLRAETLEKVGDLERLLREAVQSGYPTFIAIDETVVLGGVR